MFNTFHVHASKQQNDIMCHSLFYERSVVAIDPLDQMQLSLWLLIACKVTNQQAWTGFNPLFFFRSDSSKVSSYLHAALELLY